MVILDAPIMTKFGLQQVGESSSLFNEVHGISLGGKAFRTRLERVLVIRCPLDEPVPSENSNLASCRQLVLMDQSAQSVAPTNLSSRAPEMPVPTVSSGCHLQGGRSLRRRNLLSESLVWAMPVVVA